MPFSFLDIETRKTRRIILLFLTLLCFYFIGAILIYSVIRLEFPVDYIDGIPLENLYTLPIMFKIFAAAFLVALIHWAYSTINMVPKIISVIGAKPLDPEDKYHLMLKNIMDEVSTATGGMRIEPMVIYSGYCNAFALADFKGQTVIGVTEGLLSKVNRRQLEAVIAHEASHLVWGDCLLATISCSVAGVYSGLLKMITSGWRGEGGAVYRRRSGGYAGAAGLLLIALIAFMKFLTLFLNTWISRERELRADATAVRLTRDPLSLAESLYIISGGWRGNQLPAEELAPIFIMTPRSSRLEESSGFFANLFTTHPPTKKRIDILLDMGHADFETLKSGIKEKPRIQDEVPISSSSNSKIWYTQNKEKRLGPFNLIDLSKLDWLTPFTLITTENNKLAKPAHEYKEINAMLKKGLPFSIAVQTCPACEQGLERIYYEGVPIWRCNNCNGKLLKQSHLQRVIIRQEMECSQDIKNAIKEIKAAAIQTKHKYVKTSPSSFKCPGCGQIMNRTFYMAILPYHLEINICHVCDLIWCEQNELETIQCIIEEKTGYV